MIRFGTYLLQNSYGIYHFRMSVPLDLRPVLGKREFKKSLKTSNLVYARKAAYCYAVDTHILFEEIRSQIQGGHSNMFSDDDIKRLSNSSPRFEHAGIKISGSSIEIGPAKTDPNNPNDIKDLHSYLDKIKEMFPGAQLTVQPDQEESRAVPEDSKSIENSSLLLQELFDKYKDVKRKEDWKAPKTEKDHNATFNAIIRIIDNIPVKELDVKKAVELKEILYNYPQNVTKKEAYNHLAIAQFKGLKIPKEDLLKPPTIRKYLSRMSSVFDYAVAHGYADQNPFEKIVPKRQNSKHVKKRDQFSPEELKTLFGSPIYTELNFDKPFHYWLPLLGLFTGARISELCQLTLNDIKIKDGISFIDINEEIDEDNADKSVKTVAGIRPVPIHSILKKLGFDEYVQTLKNSGKKLLLPDVATYTDEKYEYVDWGAYASKWFSAYLKKLKIKRPKLSYHSLRHTMITELDNARVHRPIACALTGHEYDRSVHEDYIHGFKLNVLHEDIEKATFDDIFEYIKPYHKKNNLSMELN